VRVTLPNPSSRVAPFELEAEPAQMVDGAAAPFLFEVDLGVGGHGQL
jgi:hypothetical protein